ncbi:hypothetical protein GDO86_020244 [Hymenochirus boettgeri]|uniref:SHC-transforming protein 1 n=1 Tax=Hymenochirus boettgeri TaxID=247094 RepID=A0A8T2IL07_9PIPI|nr:hypothetical protein GDO86_020244 [Hymenochirus boettgeri]KAG8431740.1 hypothetical protein GDO86_020244 [Hymenochirus boettgeri]
MRPGPPLTVECKLAAGIMDLLPTTKYNHLRNESVSSVEEATVPLTPSMEVIGSHTLPSSASSSSLAPMLPLAELSSESEESPTTLCSFFPKMANLKLSNPANLLNLRGFSSSMGKETGSPGDPGENPHAGNSPELGRTFTVFSQDMNKLSCGRKSRVEGGQLAGDEWTRHGSFVNKPTRGWLHPDDKVMGPGVPYLVRYMGCVEVLQSMRSLDFNTRTQTSGRSLNSILGKSNLKFAGMPITLTVSTSSLNLMASDCKQIIANHHMQSISFASGGDPDTAEYVAYVAKDPVNQREPFEDALPSAQAIVSMEEQLKREPWYHGKMNRKEAERLLRVNGDFLVRESTTTPGQYVLTGLQCGQPKHLLLVDPEGVVRTKDHRFESVSHLISYHMDNHLPIISAGSELCLQQPVERRL